MDLDGFYDWLVARGREERTAALYRNQVQLAYDLGDPIKRLTKSKLAAKSKRVALAALRAYAKFKKDDALLEKLGDLRLPAAVRAKPKTPIEKSAWKLLIAEIDSADYFPEGVGLVLGIIATRGFRVGDVLRIQRSEAEEACVSHTLSMNTKGQRRLEFGTGGYEKHLAQLLEIDGWDHIMDLISSRGKAEHQLSQSIATLTRWLKKAAEKVGLDPDTVHLHRLRRTYACAFLDAVNGDIVKLTQAMNWADTKTAFGYVDHSRRDELDKIGEEMMRDR